LSEQVILRFSDIISDPELSGRLEEKGFWHSLETQSARGQIPTVNSEMRIFTIAANAAFPSSFSNCLIVDRPRRQRGLEQGKVAFLSTAGGVYQKYA
jgi:hypothetical protein